MPPQRRYGMIPLALFGILFGAASGYMILSGFQVSIVVAVPNASAYLPPGMDGVANLGAMHIQAMDFLLGIGAAIVAAVFFGAATIVNSIENRPA